MLLRLAILAVLFLVLAQLPGCHYYIEGTPRFIVSSEPIHNPESTSNYNAAGPSAP